MSHRCLAIELQQFSILRRSMNEVIGKFLRDGLQPVESIIAPIEMDVHTLFSSLLFDF
jgi:dynamin 1-like protein